MSKHEDRNDVTAILDRFAAKQMTGADHAPAIPRILQLTYPGKTLPAPLQENVEALRARNPGWELRLYDDVDIDRFIFDEYGPAFSERYQRIAPGYGAARADLFRYLLIYRNGGVYLDIKSTADRPLDTVLRPDDRFIVSQWDNTAGTAHNLWGLHPDLRHVPGGEFQQWFIASVPGHPFLRAVIERVLHNIDCYSPYRHGVGLDVVRITGPVAYTCAIEPLLAQYPHRRVVNESALGLRYSVMRYHAHHVLLGKHYSQRTTPVIGPPGGPVAQAALTGYVVARRNVRRVFRLARRLYRRARGLPEIRTL